MPTERMSELRSTTPSPLRRPWACFAAVLVAAAAWWGLLAYDGQGRATLIYALLIAALLAIGIFGRWRTPILGGVVLAGPIISVLWEEPTPCGDPCIDESIYLSVGICGAAIAAIGAFARCLTVLAVARWRRTPSRP